MVLNIGGMMQAYTLMRNRPVATGTASIALAMALALPAAAQTAQTGTPEGEAQDTIVVTAAGFEQKIENAPASVTVIRRQDLQEKRFGSLAEALGDVEGVDVGQSVGKTGGMTISIRGMPADYTLVLVDGRRQNAPGNVTPNGFNETSSGFLPPFSAIERIEVVRGPMSTLYGSDAMGGVVNLITRKVGDRWIGTGTAEATIQSDGDFGNQYSGNADLQGPLVRDLVGLTLRGSYFKREASDLSYDDAAGDPVEVSKRGPSPVEADIYTLGGRISATPHADHDLWVEVDIARQWYDNSASQLGTGTVQGGYGPEMRFNRDNYVLAHSWRAGFANIDTTLTRNITETFGRTIPPGTPGKTAGDARPLKATNTILDSRAVVPLDPVMLTLGGQYWKAEMIDGVAVAPYEFVQWALFGEGEIRLADSFRLTLGARYDDHETFGGKLSPRAYAVWNVTDALTVKGGVSRGFKTPRLDQITPGITGFTGQGTRPSIGTPDLKPEISTSYELGVYFDAGPVSGNVTLFNNDFTNKIAAGVGIANCSFAAAPDRPGCVDVGNFPLVDLYAQSINVDEAVTRGLEASARIEFATNLSLGVNYTYTESEQKSGAQAGQPLVNTPKHMINGNLRWRPVQGLSTWLRTEIRSSRSRGVGVEQTALGDYKGYALFQLGGSYDITPNVKLSAAVYNLLDTDFVGYLPYQNGATTAYASEYANLQEPRRLWLSATFDF
ncbi:TonB-dependent receptor domain-containing protein [Sphingomonas rustica]